MLAELYVLSGRDSGKVLDAATGPTIFLGRAATNHLRIRDSQASRVHCRIDVTTDGLTLQDTNSGNGTFINDKRVMEARPLVDGDVIRVGKTRMKILIESEAERIRWSREPGSDAHSLEDSTLDAVPSGESGIQRTEAEAEASPKEQPRTERPTKAMPRKGKLREVLPGYRLEARLGGGSRQGIAVYRATQASLERSVALKVFLPRGPTPSGDVDRFLSAAKTIGGLPHPNIVTIHDVLSRGKMRVIVMEYLSGGSLADRLDDGNPFAVSEVLAVAEAIGRALTCLHSQGVVHGGVRPSNVLLARREKEQRTYKLTNYGIPAAHHEDDGAPDLAVVAEGAFLAPEQIQADGTVDERTDVYALGATLYACACGKPPFSPENGPQLLEASILNDVPSLEEVPESLQAVIEKCLSKDPRDRYEDTAPLLEELRAALPIGPIESQA